MKNCILLRPRLLALLLFFFSLTIAAQDTRQVSEPKIPSACVALNAALTAKAGVLSDADEQRLDTSRIQTAIDACPAGRAVVLRAQANHAVFLTGPLTLKSGVTLVVSANTVLAASRDPRVFDLSPGSCGIVSARGHGCRGLITVNDATGSGIMGDGSIDGRGGADLLGQKVSWWDLAHQAKVTDQQQSVPWMIMVRNSRDFTLYRITLRNSPGFHVSVNRTDGFTAWSVKIMTPKTARNTDGIDPGSSRNVTITHCFIHTGDDNVAVKSSKAGPASNISVLHNHFYTGHGMSIGSGTDGGVDHMLVDDLTIDGADNGIRIKSDRSRGGLVDHIVYRNVCIRDTRNPILFTPMYTTFAGDRLPVYRDIALDNVHVLTPGSFTFLGLDAEHKLQVAMSNVFADALDKSEIIASNADLRLGPGEGNLAPSGNGVTVTKTPDGHPGAALPCDALFTPFPPLPAAPELAGKIPDEDKTIYVAADGTGDFYSVQRALDVAPDTGALVLVAPGTYREVLNISKPHITLRSANSDPAKTIVVNNRSAGTAGGTSHSATVNVTGDDFTAENITFQNDFNATHPQLPEGSQALALLVKADRAAFRNVRLLGNQDTLFTGSKSCTGDNTNRTCVPARQYFSDCYIEGNVDFIFGDGKTVFDNCEIRSTAHSEGFVTAQGKSYAAEDSAYIFNRCRLTAYPGVENVYLGRPWRPYATVIYLDSEIGPHVQHVGWREWHPGETNRLETVFYAERGSTGPGATISERDPHSHQLTEQEAEKYLPANFLRGDDDWDPIQRPVAEGLGSAVPSPAADVLRQPASMPAEGQLSMPVRHQEPFRIVLVGDSTVATGGGWGPGFCATLTPNVTCIDDALNGRSTKSYIDEGAWTHALSEHGQYYLIQFGHNDQKPDPSRHTDPDTTFADNLRRFLQDVRTQGGIPILVTSLSRRNFDAADKLIVTDGLADYAAATRRVAEEQHVPLLDLYALSTRLLSTMTQQEADSFDMTGHPDAKAEAGADKPDRTHLNDKGKTVFGRMVADNLVRVQVELRPNVVGVPAAPAGTPQSK